MLKFINSNSIEDIYKKNSNFKNKFDYNNSKNHIFREYIKNNDKFIATEHFYISEEVDDEKLGFYKFENSNNYSLKIIPFENNNIDIYQLLKENQLEYYIDLILISNISFTLEDTQINKSDIIKKMIETDKFIDEKLFEDLYYNETFSKKINLELPINKFDINKKIVLEDIDIKKIYLFKVHIVELNRNFYQEI
jgi:hypothetical protein